MTRVVPRIPATLLGDPDEQAPIPLQSAGSRARARHQQTPHDGLASRGRDSTRRSIRPNVEQALTERRIKLAECATIAHVVRSFVNDCVQRLLDGTLDDEAAYMAKWWCSEQQCKVTDECLQFFGGYGYMVEYPIARLYADARVQKIYGGANEIMKDLIARKLCT